MTNKQPEPKDPGGDPPRNDFDPDLDLNATHLISNTGRHPQAKLVATVVAKPTEQPRVTLGNFTASNPPKGFSIELEPDPVPEGSIVTEITSLGTTKRYRLVLHVANYGAKAVTAKVWQL